MTTVVGGIIEENGRILIAQRTGDRHEGRWEFPGGKVEEGEDHREALAREILEEFNLVISVGDYVTEVPFQLGQRQFRLVAYRALISSGTIELRHHQRIEWVHPGDLLEFDLLPPDIPIAQKLRDEDADLLPPVV